MFPFVGAPMFYSAGRSRKRKWTVVRAVDGVAAISDLVLQRVVDGDEDEQDAQQAAAGAQASTDQAAATIVAFEEEAEQHQASFSGLVSGKEDLYVRRGSASLTSGRGNEEIASEGLIGLGGLAYSSSTTSISPLIAGPSTSKGPIGKGSRRRSSSLVTRGNVLKREKDMDWDSREETVVSSLQCLLEQCANWNFDTFLLNRLSGGHAVVAIGCKIFQSHQFDRVFHLDWSALLLCLRLIENGYKQNPYHNSVHAADVAQATHCFLQEPHLTVALDPLEKMACILAAFGHDLYHPGVNQKFLEGNDHFLCQLYNRVSVLESFHWRCLVSIIKESSVFESLTREQWKKLLQMLEVLILATDMQRQQEYLNQFKPYLERGGRPRMNETDERLFVMQILIKCADISNPCRPWMVSKEWSYRVAQEFFNQGDAERRLKLPVTSFCDRYSTSVAKIQSGFMEYVAQPLFADWDQYMRSPLSSYMLRNLRINCQNWNKALREQVQQQELAQQQQSPSKTSSPARSGGSGGVGALPHSSYAQTISAASSLEEMADLEMQQPDVLKRRASSSALPPRARSPRSSLLDQPRRISLPVAVGAGATLWTASANRRMYEAISISSSDIATTNIPVRLRLSHSDVAEEESDEEECKEEESEEKKDQEHGSKCGGGGSGCGTPTPTILVWTPSTTTETGEHSQPVALPPQPHERRFSEPLVLTTLTTTANCCFGTTPAKSGPGSGYESDFKQQQRRRAADDESALLPPNLLLLQRCAPRRGSLPMTHKELEDAQANIGAISSFIMPSLIGGGSRGNGARGDVPAQNVTPIGRFVGVS